MPSTTATHKPFYADTASFVDQQFPAGHDLSNADLATAAAALGQARFLWRSHVHHDPERRHYTQLYRDPHIDIWLICWTNQQDTGFHDHDVSAGAVHIIEGELVEDQFELRDGALREISVTHPPGTTFDFDASHVHRLRHRHGTVATSIHIYSPALWRMGYYDPDASGMLRRTSISYAEETSE
jgi:hypothetical protein